MEDYVVKLKSQSSLSADDREDATSNLIAVIGQFSIVVIGLSLFFAVIVAGLAV